MREFEVECVKRDASQVRKLTIPSKVTSYCAHKLDEVETVTIYINVVVNEGRETGVTKVLLRCVPVFLVHAFDFIFANGLTSVGIFRKEGNNSRMNSKDVWGICQGTATFPSTFTVHDVCCLVKKFLRELDVPLLSCSAVRQQLIELGLKVKNGHHATRKEFCKIFEISFTKDKSEGQLSFAQVGSLGYLMRQLNLIAEHSSQNQMTVENLATIFAPTLFHLDADIRKKDVRRGSQENILNNARVSNEEAIAATHLLIQKANWIGVSVNCYLTSLKTSMRSSSENPRQPLSHDIVNIQPEVRLSKRPTKLEKRQSLTTRDIKLQDGRRSSSTIREFSRELFAGLRNRVKRSPSRETHQRIIADQRRTSSPGRLEMMSESPSSQQRGRDRTRKSKSPRFHTHTLEFNSPNTTPKLDSTVTDKDVTPTSSRVSRSQQRKANTRHPTPGPSADLNTVKSPTTPRLTRSRVAASRQSSDTSNNAVAFAAKARYANAPLKDNPVSMLGEEYFDLSYKRAQPDRQRRRHTTPVKSAAALRRNQPNTVNSGLARPQRRNTVVHRGDEKENRNKRRSLSMDGMSSSEDLDVDPEQPIFDSEQSSYSLLDQRAQESRSRRVKRQRKRGSQDVLTPTSPTVAVVASSTPKGSPSAKNIEAIYPQHKIASATPTLLNGNPLSPVPPAKTTPLRASGHAVIGASHVVMTAMPNVDYVPTDPVIHSPDIRRRSPRNAIFASPPGTTTIVVRAPSSAVPDASPRAPPLPATNPPPASKVTTQASPVAATSNARCHITVQHAATADFAATSTRHLPLATSMSLPQSSPTMTTFAVRATPPGSPRLMPRNVAATTAPVFVAPSMPSTLTRQRSNHESGMFRPPLAPKPATAISASKLDAVFKSVMTTRSRSQKPTSTSQKPKSSHLVMSDEFANSDAFKRSILNATEESELRHPSSSAAPGHARYPIEPRPSIALLRGQGVVRERVHQFSQMQPPPETNSGRSSAMSTRSSIGASSTVTNDNDNTILPDMKPTAPPVGHSQQKPTSSALAASTSSSVIAYFH